MPSALSYPTHCLFYSLCQTSAQRTNLGPYTINTYGTNQPVFGTACLLHTLVHPGRHGVRSLAVCHVGFYFCLGHTHHTRTCTDLNCSMRSLAPALVAHAPQHSTVQAVVPRCEALHVCEGASDNLVHSCCTAACCCLLCRSHFSFVPRRPRASSPPLGALLFHVLFDSHYPYHP